VSDLQTDKREEQQKGGRGKKIEYCLRRELKNATKVYPIVINLRGVDPWGKRNLGGTEINPQLGVGEAADKNA